MSIKNPVITKPLSEKQKRFCLEYVKDLNATQAAIRSGYSERTAKSQGQRLLTHVDVQALITKLKQEVAESIKIDAAWMLKASVDLYSKCMEGEELKDAQGNNTGFSKFHPAGAGKALELIGKHVDVRAFDQVKGEDETGQKVDVSFTVNSPVTDVRVTSGS